MGFGMLPALVGLLMAVTAANADGEGSKGSGLVDITDQGIVSASSTFDGASPPENAVDGDDQTSWFSDGTVGGDSEIFKWTWSGLGEVRVRRIETDPELDGGGGNFGFTTAQLRLYDADDDLRFAGPTQNLNLFRVNLTAIFSGTRAQSVEVRLDGHQDSLKGGFSEFRVFVSSVDLPSPLIMIDPPIDLAAGDRFGGAVATDGNVFAVGRPGADGGRGNIVVYRVEGTTVVEEDIIEVDPKRPVNGFGRALAIEGGRLLAAADGDTPARGDLAALQAALYERTQAGWQLKTEFGGDEAGEAFGTAVALEGSTIAIGAPGNADGTGAVYLFELDGSTVVQESTLEAPAGMAGFGQAVAMTTGRLAVGAPNTEIGNAVVGSAQLYGLVAGNLAGVSALGALNGSSAGEGSAFGSAIAIDGSTLAIGAPGEGTGGVVYLFDPVSRNETERLAPPGLPAGAQFGASIAVNGSQILIGAPGFNGGTGAVYRLDVTTALSALYVGRSGQVSFGGSVALSNDGILIGAPGSTDAAGDAQFTRDDDLVFRSTFE